MGKELPPNQMELYKRIDEILFYKWDPIGISDSDWARDEYQSYLPQVFSRALQPNPVGSISNYLNTVSTEFMGLSPMPEHDMKIANLIVEIKEDLGI